MNKVFLAISLAVFIQMLSLTHASIMENKIIYFSDKNEIFLYELATGILKKVGVVPKEKGYEIDYNSIISKCGKVYFTLENKEKAVFSYVYGSNFELKYQEGTIYQKDYIVQMNGKYDLLKTREIRALNKETLEIVEKDFFGIESNNTTISHKQNRFKSFYGPSFYEEAVKGDIKLIVQNRSLYIEKNKNDRKVLIEANKKVNLKVGYGCYCPSINKNGTKGLCCYYAYPWGKNNKDRTGIIEIDLLTDQIVKHTEIIGDNPSFSPDDRYILYKSKHYKVFDVKDKSIIKVPKAKHALWLY